MKNLISSHFSNFDSGSISAAASALQFSLDSSMARESGLISLRDEHVYSERGGEGGDSSGESELPTILEEK